MSRLQIFVFYDEIFNEISLRFIVTMGRIEPVCIEIGWLRPPVEGFAGGKSAS